MMEKMISKLNRKSNALLGAVGVLVVVLFIGLVVMISHKPVPSRNAVQQLNQALEEKRQAEIRLVNAKLDSIRLDQKIKNERDSMREIELTNRLDENTEALKRNRNEKPRDYSDLTGSADIQRQVATTVRQYLASQ